ncbi:MAG: hypothetical protein GX466_08785 [Candidatus Cloacimonetes bacterium]|nr:hypothetical protein [Candidatus Cloacimonadota bacterium]
MEELIDLLLEIADTAHRQHLATRSYAKHMALGDFYDSLRDNTDTLAEALIGMGNDVEEPEPDISAYLKERYAEVVAMRPICDGDTAAENLFDNVAAGFLSTIYKLDRLTT